MSESQVNTSSIEDREIVLTLSIRDTNMILASLGKQPYESVANLIDSIQNQGSKQVQQIQEELAQSSSE